MNIKKTRIFFLSMVFVIAELLLFSFFYIISLWKLVNKTSSTFLVNGDAYILPYRLHTYLGLNINGSPY